MTLCEYLVVSWTRLIVEEIVLKNSSVSSTETLDITETVAWALRPIGLNKRKNALSKSKAVHFWNTTLLLEQLSLYGTGRESDARLSSPAQFNQVLTL